MDPFLLKSGADFGLGLLSGGLNFGSQIYANKIAKQAFEWQKTAQQYTWQREDNAVQRRVADMKAAGINPVLAAGQAAQAGSPIKATADMRAGKMDIPSLMALSQQKAVISQTKAQTALTQAQLEKTRAEANLVRSQIGESGSRTELNEQNKLAVALKMQLDSLYNKASIAKSDAERRRIYEDIKVVKYDLDYAQKYGQPVHGNAFGFAKGTGLLSTLPNADVGTQTSAGIALLTGAGAYPIYKLVSSFFRRNALPSNSWLRLSPLQKYNTYTGMVKNTSFGTILKAGKAVSRVFGIPLSVVLGVLSPTELGDSTLPDKYK